MKKVGTSMVDARVLNDVLALAGDDISAELRSDSASVLERVYARDSLDPLTVVAAFVGATGSGKSSLFNAVMGQSLAVTDVVRPTTRVGLAALPGEVVDGARGESGAHELLNWLGVEQRVPMPGTSVLGPSMVLIDVPDIDSVDRSNGALASRLAERVDVLVWVVDPQKYADDVIHSEWIRPMASRALATIVVLNQVDRLGEAERRSVVDSLRGLLVDDGLEDPMIVLTSARTGEGVLELGERMNVVAERVRVHAVSREAALNGVADRVRTELGVEQWDPEVEVSAVSDDVARTISDSAQLRGVVESVGAAYRHRRIRSCGWLPFRVFRRFRPDPLGRLHLSGGGSDSVSDVNLDGLMGASGVSVALRRSAERLRVGRPELWSGRLSAIIRGQSETLTAEIQRGIARTDLSLGVAPRWWNVAKGIQGFFWLCALVGVVWLALVYVLNAYLFIPVDLPMWGRVPVPTVLVLGGVGVTGVVACVAAAFGVVGARRRVVLARRALRLSVVGVVEAHVLEPLQVEDARQRSIVELLRR